MRAKLKATITITEKGGKYFWKSNIKGLNITTKSVNRYGFSSDGSAKKSARQFVSDMGVFYEDVELR